MKVIVNNQTPLIVEDSEGNVLFQWLPEKKVSYDDYLKKLESDIMESLGLPPKYFK